MNWKDFFKPDKRKIIIFLILTTISSLIVFQNKIVDGGCDRQGFPFTIYEFNCIWIGGSAPSTFNYLGFLFNLITCYIVSCIYASWRKR